MNYRFLTVFVVVLVVITSSTQGQTTWHVNDDNCPGPGDGSLGNPFCSIQDAIDASVNGDDVLIQPGSYFENIDLDGKAIALRSTDPSSIGIVQSTIIDGNGVGPVVTITSFETNSTVLEGLTIREGNATLGGGIFIKFSSPIINDCIIEDCNATRGGGIYTDGSVAQLNRCIIRDNTGDGGGMYNNASSPTLVECLFEFNETTNSGLRQGGGMLNTNFSNANLQWCVFRNNTTIAAGNIGKGGALVSTSNSATSATDCVFENNTAFEGGGQYCHTSNVSFLRCSFISNGDYGGTRPGRGGAVFSNGSSPLFEDCLFDNNSLGSGVTCCSGNEGRGGAMLFEGISSPTIRGSDFVSNSIVATGSGSGWGGAICLLGSSIDGFVIESCNFIENTVDNIDGSTQPGLGGAIYASENADGEVTTSTFTQNQAGSSVASGGGFGGAIYAADVVLRDCKFDGNSADVDGGALYLKDGLCQIVGSLFVDNVAVLGSSVFAFNLDDPSVIVNCEMIGNHTGVSGGIYNHGSDPLIANCLFSGNTASSFGGGIFNFSNSDPTITNCTFTENFAFAGACIYNFDVASEPSLNNSILWGNSALSGDPEIDGPGVTQAHTNLIQGGYAPGTNILNVNPAFIDADGADDVVGTLDDDLRLGASPAIDAGSNAFLPQDVADVDDDLNTTEPLPLDLDVNTRVVDGDGVGGADVDLGAYEFAGLLDCNNNGISDPLDIISGFSVDIDGNGIPDECDPDCNDNGLADHLDLLLGLSQDCNDNLVPDECDIAGAFSNDLNSNGVPDECEDCNNNGTPDDLDIAGGSEDCNLNGVPDECDIANGTSADFNENTIPDECEPDCNNNGIPDELDLLFGLCDDGNGNDICDECECPADVTGDLVVNVEDLLAVLGTWGSCPNPCPPNCPEDTNGDCVVDVSDLLIVLGAWGPC